jgi:hypothetical protein
VFAIQNKGNDGIFVYEIFAATAVIWYLGPLELTTGAQTNSATPLPSRQCIFQISTLKQSSFICWLELFETVFITAEENC